MEDIEKLDLILNIFLQHGGHSGSAAHWITELNFYAAYISNHDINISPKELTEIFIYLVNDKVIYTEEISGISYYFSTFKGRMIKNTGGYNAKFKREKDKEAWDVFFKSATIIISFIAIIISILVAYFKK